MFLSSHSDVFLSELFSFCVSGGLASELNDMIANAEVQIEEYGATMTERGSPTMLQGGPAIAASMRA